MHIPVLLNEVLAAFAERPLKTFADLTLGAGGHAAALLEAHPEIELFVGVDQDESALALARDKLRSFGAKVQTFQTNFEDIKALSSQLGVKFDGTLADLGVSCKREL